MRALILSILVGVQACSLSLAADASHDDRYLTGQCSLDGYWLLSGKWMGFMSIALKIDKNRFQYWFYSDDKSDDEPTYPISGKVEIKKNTIRLNCPNKEHLYSDEWHLVIYKNEICLLADSHYQDYMKTDKLDDSRLLFKVSEKDMLDKRNPQMNAPIRIDMGKIMGVQPIPESKAADGKKQITNSIGMKLVLIPAGEFKMGSGESAEATAAFFNKTYARGILRADMFTDEHPQHRVRITKPFYLGTYHVTRGQFRQFVKKTGYKTDAEKGENSGAPGWNPDAKMIDWDEKYSWRNAGFEQTDEHPVVNVSWDDAVAFCKWLSKKEGKTYRLPTEAEWEYACRAGTTTRYYSGDDPETLAKVGNVADATLIAKFPVAIITLNASDGYVFTSPVGSFKPNDFGLYDMHGNAWQWCSDWYDAGYYAKSPSNDPSGPDTGASHACRGGSWDVGVLMARSAERGKPSSRGNFKGFRVARTP